MTESNLHPAGWTDEQLLRACEIRFVRRSGPGGQHRNKVESGVQLVFAQTGAIAEANERRSQAENRRVALRRLRLQLALRLRTQRDWTQPLPDVWTSRINRGRIVVSAEHDDVPRLLSIALDCLAAHDWDAGLAAEVLGCSTTQLVRFLGEQPAAMRRLNEEREARGLRMLRG